MKALSALSPEVRQYLLVTGNYGRPGTGAYPLRFDGNGPIANIITGMQIQGMPIDYPATRNDKVNAVTLEQVNDVARRYLKPDDLRFVVVGQPDGLSSTN